MKHTILFNTRTAFVVLLLGNTAFSLQALPLTPVRTGVNHKSKSENSVYKNIAELLEAKGLEKSAASEKAKQLFGAKTKNIEVKLHHIQSHPALSLSVEEINQALTRRALFEKPLNLDAYDSLVGFIQEIKGRSLEQNALEAVQQITMLNRTLS